MRLKEKEHRIRILNTEPDGKRGSGKPRLRCRFDGMDLQELGNDESEYDDYLGRPWSPSDCSAKEDDLYNNPMAHQPIEGQDLPTDSWPHVQTKVNVHPVSLGMTCGQHVTFSRSS